MFVQGWFTVVEAYTGEPIPDIVETIVTIIVMLFCLWWHSLMLAKRRVSEWARVNLISLVTMNPPFQP